MADKPVNIDELNIYITFKVTWAGFLCLEEITYIGVELKKASFLLIKVTRSDISFAEGNQYVMLCLKQSKTDIEYTGVQIIFVAAGKKTCLIVALTQLYILYPQPVNALLFHLFSGAFLRFNMLLALKKWIAPIVLT